MSRFPWKTGFLGLLLASASLALCAEPVLPTLPTVALTGDDLSVTESCVISIAPGFIARDSNTNGVIHVDADNVKIRFAPGAILRGAPESTPPNSLIGIGIRVEGRTNVWIQGVDVRGFKNGVLALGADGLVVEDARFSDNYQQHLKSTWDKESGDDWLYPHHNDQTKWRDEYGGGICIEKSNDIVVRRVTVRRTQNGILFDRVNNSAVYDCDCSFLSGWGIALWMSGGNNIQRNAFDFCVRGHFEGAYNRGQDSAGILCFEQSNNNIFAENSVTHGGDGFFGFAGQVAIGETWWNKEKARLQKETGRENVDDLIKPSAALVKDLSERGCNGNILIGNDFSDASAHGIELTFSEDNQILRNRIANNGVCGFWGGYSSRTLIAENRFERNGALGYGLERGAINMEHAADNLILKNEFINNKCGVHLWWDDDGALMKFPGVSGNEHGVVGNMIGENHFKLDNSIDFKRMGAKERLWILQMRDTSKKRTRDNYYFRNNVELINRLGQEFSMGEGTSILSDDSMALPKYELPKIKIYGKKTPTMDRRHLRGRDQIKMSEWGPEEPFR